MPWRIRPHFPFSERNLMKTANNYESVCGVRKVCQRVFSGLIVAALAWTSHAATFSWSGGSASDGNWSDSANWGFVGTPGNGDTVIFPGGVSRLTNTNDIIGLTLGQIRFVGTSGGYQIFGNGFTITNGIMVTNTAGVNSFSMLSNSITIATTDLSIVVSNGVTLAIFAPLNGTPGLVKNGAGTLILEGPLSNVYGGLTTINAGLVQMEKNGISVAAKAIPGNFVVGDGTDTATLQNIFGNEIVSTANVTINANGTWNMAGAGESGVPSITLNGNGAIATANLNFTSGTTITANPGFLENCSISGNLFVTGVGNFVVNSGGFLDGSLVVSANIGGNGIINKTGNGFLDFSGQNTFTSQVNVGQGTLGVESSFALGASSTTTIVSNTATLAVYASVTNNSLVMESTGLGIQNESGANTLLFTNFTLGVPTTIEVDGTSLELFGTITGPGGFTKTGAGPLTLSGNSGDNTYTGATIVSSGVLQLNKSVGHSIEDSSAIIIGNSTDAADSDVIRYINGNGNQIFINIPITIYESGLYDLNGHSDDAGPFMINGGDISTGVGTLENTGNMTVTSSNRNPTISGNLQMTGDQIIVDEDASFYSLLIPANISGSSFSILNGPNPGAFVRLTGSNSFTGSLTIGGLAASAETPWALGSSNGATIVNGPGELFLFQTQITNETVTLGSGSAITVQNNSSWVGPVVLAGNCSVSNFNSGMVFNIAGPISGTGNFTMWGPAGSTTEFSGSTSNSYVGLTTVTTNDILLLAKTTSNGAIPGNVVVNNGGTLRLGASEQIFDGASVIVNSGGLFDFTTFFESLDTLTGTGSVTFGANGYLNVGEKNGSSTFDGLMSGTGFAGGYTVGKFGTGTFTMTANNTYQNGSDIFAGTLIVNGIEPQSPVRIMSIGTTIGGSGVIGDFVSANGTVAPGVAGSPTIFTCSNLVFSSLGNFTVRLQGPNAGTDYDQMVVRGGNNLGSATLTLLGSFNQPPAIGQQYTIIKNLGTSGIVGTFNGLPNGSIVSAGGYTFRLNYNGGVSAKDVVLTAIGGNTITLNSIDKGWYDSTGLHTHGNSNYLSGGDGFSSNFYRDYFVFNAPSISGASIISAELIVDCYSSSGPQPAPTYLVRGVSTPIATLEAGGSGLTAIYQDLGSNAVYSERSIETNESSQFAVIPLNVKFINDITAAAGGQIALGGSVPSPATNQLLFAFSGQAANDVQLRLTYGNSVTLNAAATGWYDSTGFHDPSNSNYLAGVSGTTYHDFFMFNLPVIAGPLVNAQLLVKSYGVANPAGSNPYQLYDVSTPITTLTNNASGAVGTFNDLGSGGTYGGRDIFVSEAQLPAGIPLNTAFVSAVDANSGGQIALGGANGSTNGYVFASSGLSTNDAQLWLGSLAAPAVTPVFVNSSNLGNGKIQFTLSGTTGTSNEIQGSFDFVNWDYMGDLYMSSATSVFTYTNNSAFPYRFFRAKIMP